MLACEHAMHALQLPLSRRARRSHVWPPASEQHRMPASHPNRSVYITKQVSFRNRVLILFDW